MNVRLCYASQRNEKNEDLLQDLRDILTEARDFNDLNGICGVLYYADNAFFGTVAKLAMRQPFVLFKGLTFQKLCLPGAFRPGDHHNKMLRPGLCVVHASPQYL